jgi:hypothetical protein
MIASKGGRANFDEIEGIIVGSTGWEWHHCAIFAHLNWWHFVVQMTGGNWRTHSSEMDDNLNASKMIF